MNKRYVEFDALDGAQLVHKIEELRRELFQLRLNAATTHNKSFPAQQWALKKAIARALTKLRTFHD